VRDVVRALLRRRDPGPELLTWCRSCSPGGAIEAAVLAMLRDGG
jgi:hypothetical protein